MFSGKSSILEHDHHLLTSTIPSVSSQGVALKSGIFSFFFYFKGFGDSLFLVVIFFLYRDFFLKNGD